MREPTFLILTALAEGPRHGYGVIQVVRELSDGRVRLLTGTLYTALERLTAEGLVVLDHEELVDGRGRRYFRLTGAGRDALRAETARLRQLATAAEARLGGALRPGVA
ncbi:helix-turn-helix transcriptional regulator [Actinoplanes sp. NBRC 103695]|uniref:PadR family transcriptional regulator n=1 Tax=Actinoplanes sp. NBRC 103695 TaxID=3032202 RepID=UPI0024A31509|nr:helix-turn-helix transcriptional regulator [Actinoplanes sp. NBRC 103695]GLY94013.1 PadR family transcriptional regulator [Actinoplanes sp. NBRC 103695]